MVELKSNEIKARMEKAIDALKKDLSGLRVGTVSYTHLRAHETPEHLVCRLLLEKKNGWSPA